MFGQNCSPQFRWRGTAGWNRCELEPGIQGFLRRAPIAGGPSQLVLNELGFSTVSYARSPSNLCVVDQRIQGQLIFFAFAPLRGKGRELARIALHSAVAQYGWDLSPDGSRVAITRPVEQQGRIQVLSLGGQASRDVQAAGWNSLGASWSLDGKGWFVSGKVLGTEAVLHVDQDG